MANMINVIDDPFIQTLIGLINVFYPFLQLSFCDVDRYPKFHRVVHVLNFGCPEFAASDDPKKIVI